MKYLLIFSFACYAVGTAFAVFHFIRRKSNLPKPALGAVLIGFLAHTVSLLARGVEVNRCPLLLYQEVFSFLAWVVTAYYLGVSWRYRAQALSLFVLPVVLLFALTGLLLPTENVPTELVSPGNHWLLVVHVALFVFSYGAFAMTFLAGVMYLIQERQLKLKKFGTAFFRLPSLDTCDDLSYKSLGAGFVLLTLGIVTGIAGSRHIDGIYWHGDPLEFLVMATWFVYLFMVHCRLTAGWRGRRAAFLGIAGFAMAMVSLAGVGYLSGFHFE